jgi:hypothetical protein
MAYIKRAVFEKYLPQMAKTRVSFLLYQKMKSHKLVEVSYNIKIS